MDAYRTAMNNLLYIFIVLVYLTLTQAFKNTSTTVQQIAGFSVELNCQVHNLGDSKVVWRGPSESFLTIGTISFDKRFSVSTPYANEWNLHIRNLKRSDEGEYECIANTKPRQYKRVMLVVKDFVHVMSTTTATTTTSTTTTTQSTTESTTTSTTRSSTLPSSNTTSPKVIATTTKRNGVIIDEDGDNDIKYSVITTTSIRPISPAEKDPANSGNRVVISFMSLQCLLLLYVVL